VAVSNSVVPYMQIVFRPNGDGSPQCVCDVLICQ